MVCIFPQGTRQKSSEVLPPRRGVAMIAAMTGAPVVPIFISRKAKATKKTTVYIGKPIYTGLSRKSTKEEISAKSLELMDIIYDLSEVYHKQ
jgi:1-acyl-sn-glycerol-3-phosphate acyltransferase